MNSITGWETMESVHRGLATGEVSSRSLVEEALQRACDPNGEGSRVFLRLNPEDARRTADGVDLLRCRGIGLSPIAGLPVSIKDLFDVEGQVTTAGSTVRRSAPPAARDATVVARLKSAGAVILGRTNMTEFAYSGVGMNPHYGTPANPYARDRHLIPGGSSSGAAVSVTDGMAFAAIGSDTGGSVRIPAALCGITGFKPTQRRIPLDGIFPLSTTLDSVGVLARSVRCCATLDAVLAGGSLEDLVPVDLRSIVAGIPRDYFLEDLHKSVAQAFERAIQMLSSAGVCLREVGFPEASRIAAVNANGGLVAAESYVLFRRLAIDFDACDPLVRERVLRGESIRAADYTDMLRNRAAIMDAFDQTHGEIDAIVCPTTPIVAPEIQALEQDADEFRRVNALLLRNPSIVNFLNRCALSLPCQQPGEVPVGLMIIGRHCGDRALLSIGAAIEQVLSNPA